MIKEINVAYIIPGSGGTFYCENCLRDMPLVRGLRRHGAKVTVIPLYLPLFTDGKGMAGDTPVFFGAVNMYLKERFPLFQKLPGWLDQLFDLPPFLKLAARFSGSTDAAGLEDMTLSMIRGEGASQEQELKKMIALLREKIKPDIIHISNILLLGMGLKLKQALSLPLVCSLQDEDVWLESMRSPFGDQAVNLLSREAAEVDMFLPVSRYYADKMKGLLGLEEAALRVIPIGIDTEDYYPRDTAEKQNGRDLIIGYLSRLSQPFGLDLLAAAWVRLKPKFPSLKLHITGGRTGSDRAFNHRVHRILQPYLRKGEIKIFPHFDLTNRVRFLSKLDILSVPLRRPEAFGTYLLEAMAMGVPVVQPSMGAMMEIVGRTGGGLLYNPGSPRALESALEALLQDPKLRGRLGSAGADAVRKEWNIENVTKQILQVYTRICGQYERKDRKKGKNMLLTVRKIHKSYFSAEGLVLARVLNGIDLTLSEGQTMAIVGPSGSGKSTLLNIIGTLDKPDSGDLLFQGRRLNDLNEQEGSRFRNRSIGFVFQRHHLLPRFSLLDNVLLPAIAYPDGNNYEERAHFLLQKMGLERRAGFSVARLSGGERQRVAVARALLMKPRLLLADEPTGALDYENAALVFDLLLHLVEEEGLTLLAVTHSDELADRLNNKFVLRDGVLIGDT